MVAADLGGSSGFIRELLPQDLKFDFDSMARDEAIDVARYLADRGRQGARPPDGQFATGRAGFARWPSSKSRSLDAPSWLWSSVVALVASHETAYLEHCRRYALAA